MSASEGILAIGLIVFLVVIVAFWWWLSWVAIGMLIVYWALPSDIVMHWFLWLCVNAVIGGSVKFK